MRTRWKQIIKSIIFVIIFILLFQYFTGILQLKWVEYGQTGDTYIAEGFRELEPDSIELAAIGNSQVLRGLSCMHLLEKYGIAAYSASSASQPMMGSYYYAKQILKKQHLKAAVIDASSLFEEVEKSEIRHLTDTMPFSMDKLELIWNCSRMLSETKDGKASRRHFWSLVLPMMQFHSRWEELTEDDFDYHNNKQFVFRGNTSRMFREPVTDIIVEDEKTEIPAKMNDNQLYYFRKIMDLFRERQIPVTIIKTPKTDWTGVKMQAVQALADEYGVDYLDFNTRALFDAAGLDESLDFADDEHLNNDGAIKLTDYLGKYLSEHYDFTEAELTSKDKKELKRYHRMLAENTMMMTEDPVEFLKALAASDAEAFVEFHTDGNRAAALTDENGGTAGSSANAKKAAEETGKLQKMLAKAGLSLNLQDDSARNYFAHLSGKKVLEEREASYKIEYEETLADGRFLKVRSNNAGDEKAKLVVNEETTEFEQDALHIYVFDREWARVARCVTVTWDAEDGVKMV